jgi:UDPglucose 6-dehydrogenase
VPFIETDLASAQMIKYASNAFLATRISFINEIAGLCESVGADVEEVVRGLSDDPRIGSSYFQAGIGFGGPCLEKDLRALIKIAEGDSYVPRLFQAVIDRNDDQIWTVISKLKRLTGDDLRGMHLAVLGLSFKAGTKDVRNSLSIKIVERLERDGALIQAHDPSANDEARPILPHVQYFDDPYDAVQDADGLLILTRWPSFQDLDFSRIKTLMKSPNIVDGWNLLDPRSLAGLGFSYLGVGRP